MKVAGRDFAEFAAEIDAWIAKVARDGAESRPPGDGYRVRLSNRSPAEALTAACGGGWLHPYGCGPPAVGSYRTLTQPSRWLLLGVPNRVSASWRYSARSSSSRSPRLAAATP